VTIEGAMLVDSFAHFFFSIIVHRYIPAMESLFAFFQ